jgi:hypothetical protein
VRCVLCESGHVEHAHRVGVEGVCADCRKPGVVVSTDATNFDATIKTQSPLEVSAYPPRVLTCCDCEGARFKTALPKRGVCAACGRPKTDSALRDPGFAESFCDDACRSAWLTRQKA